MAFVIESKMLAKSEKKKMKSKLLERTLAKVAFVIESKMLAKSEKKRIESKKLEMKC